MAEGRCTIAAQVSDGGIGPVCLEISGEGIGGATVCYRPRSLHLVDRELDNATRHTPAATWRRKPSRKLRSFWPLGQRFNLVSSVLLGCVLLGWIPNAALGQSGPWSNDVLYVQKDGPTSYVCMTHSGAAGLWVDGLEINVLEATAESLSQNRGRYYDDCWTTGELDKGFFSFDLVYSNPSTTDPASGRYVNVTLVLDWGCWRTCALGGSAPFLSLGRDGSDLLVVMFQVDGQSNRCLTLKVSGGECEDAIEACGGPDEGFMPEGLTSFGFDPLPPGGSQTRHCRVTFLGVLSSGSPPSVWLQAVDPNANDPQLSLLQGSVITTDPNRLATGGASVDGLVADGVTPVVQRQLPPSSGSVTFTPSKA